MAVDSKLLRAFLTVADLGSLSRAAERLHISQPALSRQIRQLEDSTGQKLFERTGRGLQVTEAGAWLQRRAGVLIVQFENLGAELQARHGRLVGRVGFGCLPSMVDTVADRVLPGFRNDYPDVTLDIRIISSSSEIRDGLLDRLFDLGTLYDGNLDQRLAYSTLESGELFLVGPPGASLAEDKPVAYSVLSGLSLVLPRAGQGLRQLIDRQTADSGLILKPWLEADAPQLMVALVKRGLAYTILPWPAVKTAVQHREITAAPIERPALRYCFVAAWPASRLLSEAAKAFLSRLRADGRVDAGEIVSPTLPRSATVRTSQRSPRSRR